MNLQNPLLTLKADLFGAFTHRAVLIGFITIAFITLSFIIFTGNEDTNQLSWSFWGPLLLAVPGIILLGFLMFAPESSNTARAERLEIEAWVSKELYPKGS